MRNTERSPIALLLTAAAVTLATMALVAVFGAGEVAADDGGGPAGGEVDFARDVVPILAKRCSPCHFEGGKMHEKAPFDRPETLVRLERPILRRIKAEEEQAVLRAFLEQRGD